jgi:hypothetical protein
MKKKRKNIFSKKKQIFTFEQEVQEQIFQCENSIFEYQREIHKINNLALDLIHKTFKVPKEMWYEELQKLNEITQLPVNENISKEMIEDVLNVAKTYKEQVELRKLKIDACRLNIQQLQKLKIEEQKIRNKIEKETSNDNLIEDYKEKALELSETDITNEIVISEKVKILTDKIKEMKEELDLKQETSKQLQILFHQYGEKNDAKSNKILIEEIKKLLKK